MKLYFLSIALLSPLLLVSCWTITVKHKVDPIYVTVNVNVKVERQLNDFFDYEDQGKGGSNANPAPSAHNPATKEK
jgi:hypothetical protein